MINANSQTVAMLKTLGYAVSASIFCALLIYYGLTEKPTVPITYEGFYGTDQRHSNWIEPCGTRDRWLLMGETRRISMAEESMDSTHIEPLYLVVEGHLSDTGKYGHGGFFERELLVTRVIEVGKPDKMRNCGISRI